MFWVNLLILACLAAGHAEILIAVVNRLHARTFSAKFLRTVRHLHDMLVPTFPLILLFGAGLGKHGVLRGGRWQDLPWYWQAIAAVCAAGFVGLLWACIRWWTRKVPAARLRSASRVIDLEQKMGYRPLGQGPRQILAGVPGNQLFELELTEQELGFARLPKSYDGLSIVHLTDLHFTGVIQREWYEEVIELAAGLRPDMFIFTGDLLDDHRLIEWLPETLGRLQAPLGCWFILGNHDCLAKLRKSRQVLQDLGWNDLGSRTAAVGDRESRLVLAGSEVPWIGSHPEFDPADESFRILLSHTPDHFRLAQQNNVDLMLSGHNHGGQVIIPGIGPVYSPSRHGVKYASGLFEQNGTLLFVSRGLSGCHPLRLNCRPELASLVLRRVEGNQREQHQQEQTAEDRRELAVGCH